MLYIPVELSGVCGLSDEGKRRNHSEHELTTRELNMKLYIGAIKNSTLVHNMKLYIGAPNDSV